MIQGPSFDVLHLHPGSTANVDIGAGPIQYVSVFYVQSLLGCLLGRCCHGSSQNIYISKKETKMLLTRPSNNLEQCLRRQIQSLVPSACFPREDE